MPGRRGDGRRGWESLVRRAGPSTAVSNDPSVTGDLSPIPSAHSAPPASANPQTPPGATGSNRVNVARSGGPLKFVLNEAAVVFFGPLICRWRLSVATGTGAGSALRGAELFLIESIGQLPTGGAHSGRDNRRGLARAAPGPAGPVLSRAIPRVASSGLTKPAPQGAGIENS